MHKNRRSEAGYMMMEILLGIAVLGVAMTGYLLMQAREQEVETGRKRGEELASYQALFVQYFLANRSEMIAAMGAANASDANVQKHCVIKVTNLDAAINPGTVPGSAGPNGTLIWSGGAGISDGKKTCAIDLTLLQAKGLWPRGMSVASTNPDTGGQGRWVAIFRRPRAAGPDGVLGNADDVLSEDAEMLLVFADDDGSLSGTQNTIWRKDVNYREKVLAQSGVLGQSGGFIPMGNTTCAGLSSKVEACGSGWKIDLDSWIDSSQLSVTKAVLPGS